MKRIRRLNPPNNDFNKQREELLDGFQNEQEYVQRETEKIANDPSYTASQKIELLNAYKAEYNHVKNQYAEAWEDINQREQAYLSAQFPEQSVDLNYSNISPEMDDSPVAFSTETEFDGQDYRDYTEAPASEAGSTAPDYCDVPEESSSEEFSADPDYCDLPEESSSEEFSADPDYCDLPEESSSEEFSADPDYCDLPEGSSSEVNANISQDQSSGQGSDNGMNNDM